MTQSEFSRDLSTPLRSAQVQLAYFAASALLRRALRRLAALR